MTTATTLPTASPEAWERLLGTYQGWCARHPGFVLRLRRVVQVAFIALVPLFLLAVAFLPRFGQALVPAVFMTGCVGVVTLLARIGTVSWRVITTVFSAGIPWAFGVALFTAWLAGVSGLRVTDHGPSVALAAYVEESAKLVPLLVVCLLAPGRVRRFATVDWALLGYAAGAGFVVAEDGIRRLQRPGLLDMFLGGDAGLPQSFDPLTSGMFTSPDGLVLAAGHQVWTASIAMGIGLGLALWRSKGLRMGRLWAWAPPLATLAMAVSDHAAYNAYVSPSNWPATGGEGFPGWMWFVWTLGFKGRAVFVVAVVLFIACLLVDAHRRVAAGRYGVTVPDAPGIGSPALASWPRFVRVPAQAACAFLSAAWSDVAVVWAAHAARGGNRAKAMLAGREAGLLVRRTRADAMLATAGGTEPRSRTLFRIGALLLGAAGIGACLAYGVLVARDIGRLLAVSGDHPYFAGLLDMLAT